MARVTLTVDDQMLKDARKITGEKTNAGAVRKALSETVRVAKLKVALDELQKRPRKATSSGRTTWKNCGRGIEACTSRRSV